MNFLALTSLMLVSLSICLGGLVQASSLAPKSAFVKGPYTDALDKIAGEWPKSAAALPEIPDDRVAVQRIADPTRPMLMGFVQAMKIHAPLQKVEEILDDFNHYADLFPGLDEVKVLNKTELETVVEYKQSVPVFFLPHVTYHSIYTFDRSSPSRRMYRYRLKEAGRIQTLDGLIILEAEATSGETRYAEYDFYEADWGLLKSLGEGKIWAENLKDIILADWVIKIKAENPSLNYTQIAGKSEEFLKSYPLEQILKQTAPLKF